MMCIDLAREGFTNITGVDYSENAVILARKVADQAGVDIKYEVWKSFVIVFCE